MTNKPKSVEEIVEVGTKVVYEGFDRKLHVGIIEMCDGEKMIKHKLAIQKLVMTILF